MIHELLKDAYINEDWDLVAQAYKGLTGKPISKKKEKVVATKKKRGRPKKVNIVIPTSEDLDLIKEEAPTVLKEAKEDFTLISKPVKNADGHSYGIKTLDYLKVPNKFKDDGKLEKDSSTFDKKVRNKKNNKPVERRNAPEFIKMKCKDCNKSFKVLDGDLKEGDEGEIYYRCDDCWVERKYVRND